MGLDIQEYRRWENLAKNNVDNFHFSEKHNLDVFEKFGFPIRLESISSIRPLLNSMQDGRFDAYMEDLGGLTPDELELFCNVCHDLIKFQLTHFPYQQAIIPFDTLISALSIYLKIKQLSPEGSKVIEFGPGAGYLAFFLKQMTYLNNYTQVEACESFYFLQNKINQFLFKDKFISKLPIVDLTQYKSYYRQNSQALPVENIEKPFLIPYDRNDQCVQYPWWNMNQFMENDDEFDIVTSNANLLEFSTEALYDYLDIIKNKLNNSGIFYVQCFGYGGAVGRSIDGLWDALYKLKFAPLFISSKSHININQLINSIPGNIDNLILLPAGLTTRQLVSDYSFREQYSITMVDNAVKLKGFPSEEKILTPEEIEYQYSKNKKLNSLALILHREQKIVDYYIKLCNKIEVPYKTMNELDCDRQFAVPYGVFIGDKHPLFNEHYKRENYDISGTITNNANNLVNDIFFPDETNRIKYTKQEIYNKVNSML